MYQHRHYHEAIRNCIRTFEKNASKHTPAAHKERVRAAVQKIEAIVRRVEDDRKGFQQRDFAVWAVMFKEAIVALSDLLLCCDVQPPVLPEFNELATRACPASEFGLLDWLKDLASVAIDTARAIEARAPPSPPASASASPLDEELARWVKSGCEEKLEVETKGCAADQLDAFILKAVHAGFRCRLAYRDLRLASTGQLVRYPHPFLIVDRPC